MRKRKGFTMVEMIACTVMLALLVVGVVNCVLSIQALRAKTADSVLLSTHNINCLERLRQMAADPYEEILLYYGDETFGSSDIATDIVLEKATIGSYNVWCATITSEMRDTHRKLVSTYTITNIGGIDYTESFG